MEFSSGFVLILLIVWFGWGAITGAVAASKNRSFLEWMLLGMIFPIAILFLLIASDAPEQIPTIQSAKKLNFEGEKSLNNDAYKIYLVEKYNIRKNDVLDKYIFNEKIFSSIDEALREANKHEYSTSKTSKPDKEKVETIIQKIENSGYSVKYFEKNHWSITNNTNGAIHHIWSFEDLQNLKFLYK